MSFREVGYRFRYMEWAKTVMEAGLPGVIDVGSSGIAPVTLRELGIRLADLELYGPHYYGEPELRRRIARLARTSDERVLPTLGASHAHFLVCASLLESGDEVIVETPGYEALSAVPIALGAKVVPLPRRFEDGFQFDPRELRRRLTRRTRLVLVTNLHNPSGMALSPECLAALADMAGGADPAGIARSAAPGVAVHPSSARYAASSRGSSRGRADVRGPGGDAVIKNLWSRAVGRSERGAGDSRPHGGPGVWREERSGRGDLASSSRGETSSLASSQATVPPLERGVWVVVNEVYRDFVFRRPPPPGHTLGPRGVSLGSLTKVYGLGETRIGWAVGDPGLVHRASRVNDFGVVNGPYIAERIGALALERRTGLLARARSILHRNRPLLTRFLRDSPALELIPPANGTVAFPRLRGIEDTSTFAARALKERGVCVVPGEFFGAPGHIRIGIGARDARRLAEGLRRLRDAIGEALAHPGR